MPAKTSLKLNQDPYDFFYEPDNGVLYKYGTTSGDRFSRLEGTHINIPKSQLDNNPVSSDIGFDYSFIQFIDKAGIPTGEWAYLVLYIKKGTSTEKEQKLRRGHLITKVDGVTINSSNRFSLLYQNKASYTLSVNDYKEREEKVITVNVTYDYKENPIYLDSIYTTNSKKIGYIMYNSFDGGALATLPYDVQLSETLTRFKDEGISDLILDFRYNGGGLVRSAQFLASAIVPATRNKSNIFEIKKYNPSIQQQLDAMDDTNPTKISWMYDYFEDEITNRENKVLASIPSLGNQLNNLYVIGTRATASASEMIINTLRPYMEENGKKVIVVGEKTLGKNVGSWAVYKDNDPKNTYVMWPITFKTYNKKMESNYSQGFEPQIERGDLDIFLQTQKELKPIGDITETLLEAAIQNITNPQKGYSTYKKSSNNPKFKQEGSSLDLKQNANKMLIDEDKSNLLRKQLKTLSTK